MKTIQGQKIENPFKNNAEVKKGLTQMFGSNVSKHLTDKDVYKYTQTEEEQIAQMKLMGVKTYEKRQRNSDGVIIVSIHNIK